MRGSEAYHELLQRLTDLADVALEQTTVLRAQRHRRNRLGRSRHDPGSFDYVATSPTLN